MVESSVQAKTGSSFWEMTLLRLIMSFVIAFSLNWVMPHEGWGQVGIAQSAAVCDNWLEVFVLWFYQLDEGGDFYFDNCYGFNDPSLYIGRV